MCVCVPTPAKEGGQAPAQWVDPDSHEDDEGPFPWQHTDRGQRSRDDKVSVDGDHCQRDHGADPKESTTEGVELTACRDQTMFVGGLR